MDRPRRKISRINYKNFNEIGLTDNNPVQFSFQKKSGMDECVLQICASDDDELDLSGEEGASAFPLKSMETSGPSRPVSVHLPELGNDQELDSDEERELRVKLLEDRKKQLKKEQLNQRILELEAEIHDMSNTEKPKPKKKGELTIKELRKDKKLNSDVSVEMKRLGLYFDSEVEACDNKSKTSSKLKEASKDKKKQTRKDKARTLVVSKSRGDKRVPDSSNLRGISLSDSSSDTDSTSSEDSDYELCSKLASKSKKSLKSGMVVKSTDKVVNPQFFPHNYLQYEYVSKDIEFKQLNFKMLVAGELEIINNFCKNKSEKEGRLRLLQNIAYYSSTYVWTSVLDFYAAWLRLIELGRKSWDDDSKMLENVVLGGHNLSKETKPSTFRSANKNQAHDQVWFCVKYQRNKCEQTKSPHSTVIRGVTKMVHHICATCLQKEHVQKEHPECSDKCTNKMKV